jgi:glycosyltransferase involved in cell wall biosynthesis
MYAMPNTLNVERPLFSVILPTRDRTAMLRRAVSSVCRQSLANFELIIVDDGSKRFPDDLFHEDPRIRILRNSSSLGVAEARNLGIRIARGTYISFLDDDDEYLSSFLSSTYESLKDTPDEIGASWCGVKFVDYHSGFGRTPTVRIVEFAEHDQQKHIQDFISIGMGYGVTIKADCFTRVGPFTGALRVMEDTDMFLRILSKGFRPRVVAGVHVICHNHREPRLTCTWRQPERVLNCKWLLKEHSTFLDEHPAARRNLLFYMNSLRARRTVYFSLAAIADRWIRLGSSLVTRTLLARTN